MIYITVFQSNVWLYAFGKQVHHPQDGIFSAALFACLIIGIYLVNAYISIMPNL